MKYSKTISNRAYKQINQLKEVGYSYDRETKGIIHLGLRWQGKTWNDAMTHYMSFKQRMEP